MLSISIRLTLYNKLQVELVISFERKSVTVVKDHLSSLANALIKFILTSTVSNSTGFISLFSFVFFLLLVGAGMV